MHARRICAAWYEIGISPRARSWPVGFFDRLHRLRAWNRLSGGLEIKILDGGSRGLLLLLFFSCAKLLYVSLFRPTGWFAVLTLKERRYLFPKNCWPVSRTRFSLSTINATTENDSSTSTCSAGVGARPSTTTCDGEQVRHLVILRGYLHDSGMLSFRNEFRSRMKFVLHSHDAIDELPSLFAIFKMIRMRNRLIPHGLRFLFQNELCFHFTWYQNEISYREDNFIQIEK